MERNRKYRQYHSSEAAKRGGKRVFVSALHFADHSYNKNKTKTTAETLFWKSEYLKCIALFLTGACNTLLFVSIVCVCVCFF